MFSWACGVSVATGTILTLPGSIPARASSASSVCGLLKARAVLLWRALVHNLMRMRSLNIAFAP